MPVGGKRPGAGRPKGSRNKRTQEVLNAAAKEGITPLDYMLKVMRDEDESPATRLDAAKSAAPYLHPRLQTTTVKGDADEPVHHVFKWLDA